MSYKHIEVKPTSTYIGAEIGSVDLSRSLADSLKAEHRLQGMYLSDPMGSNHNRLKESGLGVNYRPF